MEYKSRTHHKDKLGDKRSRRRNPAQSDSESEASFRDLKSDCNDDRKRKREEGKDDEAGRGLYADRENSSKYGVREASDRGREPCDSDYDHGIEIRHDRHGEHERFCDGGREIRGHDRDIDRERSHDRRREKTHIHKRQRSKDQHNERGRNSRSPDFEGKTCHGQDHRRMKGLKSDQGETLKVCHANPDQHQDKYNTGCSVNCDYSSEFEPDYEFDYMQYKHSLNKIFFRDQDYIKR